MMVKNEKISNILAHFPHIFMKMAKDILLMLFVEPFQWKNIAEIPKLLPVYLKKRKINLSQAKVSAKEMKKWFI